MKDNEATCAILREPVDIPNVIDDEGRKLRLKAEHRLLKRIIADLDNGVEDKAISPEQVCKYLQGYCELKKQDAVREKNVVALRVASVKPMARTTAVGTKQPDSGVRQPAPYGKKDDGTPYTHAEFRAVLARSVRDIYGLSTPDVTTANAALPVDARPKSDRGTCVSPVSPPPGSASSLPLPP
ncbi:MAG: hypothetical protein ABII12_08825 [Planctomycetota bacterium]